MIKEGEFLLQSIYLVTKHEFIVYICSLLFPVVSEVIQTIGFRFYNF